MLYNNYITIYVINTRVAILLLSLHNVYLSAYKYLIVCVNMTFHTRRHSSDICFCFIMCCGVLWLLWVVAPNLYWTTLHSSPPPPPPNALSILSFYLCTVPSVAYLYIMSLLGAVLQDTFFSCIICNMT